MTRECPHCKRDGIILNDLDRSGEKEEFTCFFCKEKIKACASCGGTGCGDFPYPCDDCKGSGTQK